MPFPLGSFAKAKSATRRETLTFRSKAILKSNSFTLASMQITKRSRCLWILGLPRVDLP